MKTEKQDFWYRGWHWVLAAGVLLAGCGAFSSCEEYDLDERTPDGWGASIYSWLDEQGNYTNTVQMINDLGYRDVLAKTGSKTLFVADDAAFERFYANNPWGVSNYKQLTTSQKKLLIFGSMMDNSMQLNSLPSVEGNPPQEGQSMRRFASTSEFDSVTVIRPEQMPDNMYWDYLREAGKPVVCMTDYSKVTLVQFIEKWLANNRITNDDYNFLFNGRTNRQAGEASINGVQVAQANIKCSNGFIHRMEEVMTPLPNMAELIRTKAKASSYNKLLERYCAPYPDEHPDRDGSVTMQYNRIYNTSVDTVYQKRFFSYKSNGGSALNKSPNNGSVIQLKFDPEWNSYYAGDAGTGNTHIQKDMAVMMVPSNEALDQYWTSGAGSILREQYKTWENVPNDVISELISNNMLSSFLTSVPSKFKSILNDANDPMGVEVADIDSVWLGCNGAVYLTNKVYSPTTFVSVLYPALTNESMKILYWAAKKCRYNVYLNSLNSRYSFFIPNKDAMLQYVDPVSYGKAKTQLFQFHWDPTKVAQPDRERDEQVWASVWNYDPETGEIGDSLRKASFDEIKDRLQDILDNHIVIGDVEDGQEYYQTKGGTFIRITKNGSNEVTHVEGSYQIDKGMPIEITRVYDQTKEGNGKAYILESEPIMTTRKSAFDVLGEFDEFTQFRDLLEGSPLLEQLHDKMYATPTMNLSPLNTYHSTLYVPTNESIEALIKSGELSTWDQVEQARENGDPERATADSLAIVSFLRYHIQDNSLMIGGGTAEDDFETALIDAKTHRFYHVHSQLDGNSLTIRDNAGNVANVMTSTGLYNLMAREYQFNANTNENANQIQTTSSVIIHQIDRPLMYSASLKSNE